MTPAVQREIALSLANEIRTYRAQVKHEVAHEGRDWRAIIMRPDDRLTGMRVRGLLLAIPGTGATKASLMLAMAHVSDTRTLGQLTDRQRLALCDRVPGLSVRRALKPSDLSVEAPAVTVLREQLEQAHRRAEERKNTIRRLRRRVAALEQELDQVYRAAEQQVAA